jgi:hypothetical protein
MARRWEEVVRLRFKGERFRDHALDLSALSELSQFQKMVAETAKALWRAANPGRERLPKSFETRVRLCVRSIQDGSATVPLEVHMGNGAQTDMLEREPTELDEAIALAYAVYDALERDTALPDPFPRSLLSEYSKWGEGLGADEEVEFTPRGRTRPARLNPLQRNRLVAYEEAPHENEVVLTGVVLEADVKCRRFQLWTDDKTSVVVGFSESQESEVTTALKGHNELRLHLRGRADVSPEGKILHVREVRDLQVLSASEQPYDPDAKPIEEILAELAKGVPDGEWDKLPNDLTDNLDHYLYGTPKK